MARVTVEDCILNIPNRFDLVVTAAQRSKQIASGMPLTIDRDNDKDAVVSLREIADKTIDLTIVQEELIQHFQKKHGFDPMDRIEGEDADETANQFLPSDAAFAEVQHFASQDSGGMSFVEENIEVED